MRCPRRPQFWVWHHSGGALQAGDVKGFSRRNAGDRDVFASLARADKGYVAFAGARDVAMNLVGDHQNAVFSA